MALTDKLTAIADAIRAKDGSTATTTRFDLDGIASYNRHTGAVRIYAFDDGRRILKCWRSLDIAFGSIECNWAQSIIELGFRCEELANFKASATTLSSYYLE